MKTIKVTPRGYCHGVVNAINTITKIGDLSTKKPIYILGMVIHNKKVVESFHQNGLITLHDPSKTRLELLDEIDSGTVVFTAHGVSPEIYKKAEEKGLDIIDTTCKDVTKGMDVIQDYISRGYDVIYIGKQNHPESEAACGISDRVHFVETKDDIATLQIQNPNIAITNQTTMSFLDVYQTAEAAKEYFPNITFIDEICNATRIRQEAVIHQEKVDHCFIVGDKLSNNSIKLAAVSEEQASIPATLIESVSDIDIDFLKTLNSVSVSSGASTPTKVTNEVIQFLQQFDPNDPTTHDNQSKITSQNLFQKNNSI